MQEAGRIFADPFFRFLNFFDTPIFFFLLIPAIWLGFQEKAGRRLFYIAIISGLINHAIKQFFETPRPFHLDPSIALLHVKGHGFPSGGAQSAILLSAILLYYVQTWWSRLLAINFFFWISLSRIYLGVHFFTDVLGGWAVGLCLFGLFIYLFPLIEHYFKARHALTSLIASQLPTALLLYFFHDRATTPLLAATLGLSWGVFISHYSIHPLHPSKNLQTRIGRAVVGIGGTLALYFIFVFLPIYSPTLRSGILFFCLGLWLSWGSSQLLVILTRRCRC